MDRSGQRIGGSAPQQEWPYRSCLTAFLGLSFLLLSAGCAEIDQLMGKQATVEPQPTVQDKDPAKKQTAKKKVDESPPPSTATAGTARQTDQEKASAEKKETKSHVASDKKPKKLPKPQTESQPPTEDVFLSPIPLPTKPAAIGGSGG